MRRFALALGSDFGSPFPLGSSFNPFTEDWGMVWGGKDLPRSFGAMGGDISRLLQALSELERHIQHHSFRGNPAADGWAWEGTKTGEKKEISLKKKKN